ncbi:MAG TPA: efflux RND transporter periplasmic adaptor subunit [Candidatus Krumholzibacteria bacterium]|nr:efflux RND transporter periplasmic adaptor subunit [Candidatus Krumholzibacteria bacterium]
MNSVVQSARTNASLIIVLTVLASTVACHRAQRVDSEQVAPVAVHVAVIENSGVPRVVEVGGTLHGAREAVLSAKVMGSILEIRKRAGDAVVQGEVLVVLDEREVAGNIGQAEGAVAQARAAASLAESNFKRYEFLFARGAASQLELDQARSAHESAQGAMQQAQSALDGAASYRSYARIPAPFDGRLVDRMADVGDLASPGRPLLRVEDARRLRLHVSLPETEANAAESGASVDVVVPSIPDGRWTGTVAEIVPAVDPATRTLLVKIDLPEDARLRSGLFARARFAAGERFGLHVPAGAVLRRGGMEGVFVVDGGRASFRLLKLADARTGDDVEVLAGLDAGAQVVLDPPAILIEGSPVEVQP